MNSHPNQVEYQFNIHFSIIATTVTATAIAVNQDALIDNAGDWHYRNSNIAIACATTGGRLVFNGIEWLPRLRKNK